MDITGINHINIVVTAEQLPDMVAFYTQVMGLQPGPRAVSKRPGAWLYGNGTAIIHLSVVGQPPYPGKDGHFNHVALTCHNVAAWAQHLSAQQVVFELDYRPEPEMAQIFLYDAVGIRIELNFAGERLPANLTGEPT